MAQVAWRKGMNDSATFSLFFRGYSKDRAYYAVAGIESALSHLESLHFTDHDLDYLRSTSLFDSAFVDQLAGFRFTGSVRAMREGTLAFADEPVLEVTAPLIEAQIVETALLNAVTFQTIALTKAVRIMQAAGDRPVVEFGARRAQGTDAAEMAARSSAIAGFTGTSNLKAAAMFGIPTAGTMAHSFIQSFGNELEAFRAYAIEFPSDTTLLVDTYDTLNGVGNAITVGGEMEASGERLGAVRLDSGDLLLLSTETRKMLDEAGLDYVRINATGGLDEHSISELVSRNAPIDGFGVGTRFVVSADAPYANSVYKLVSYSGRNSAKLSTGKASLPGAKQVFRSSTNGAFSGDAIGTAGETSQPGAAPLLDVVMESGVRTGPAGDIERAGSRLLEQLRMLPSGPKKLKNPEQYPVSLTPALRSLQEQFASENAGF